MKPFKCIMMVASVMNGIACAFATNVQGTISGAALCIAFAIAAAAEK